MQSDIDLAGPFHYSIWYIVVVGFLLFLGLGIIVWLKVQKKSQKEIVVKKQAPLDLAMIKKKYIMRLDELSKRINNDNPRSSYQELSYLMRSFVFEVTGVKVTKYTLREIDRKKFPVLYDMIKEFYLPEFSEEGYGDLMSAIGKVRVGIESWK